VNSFVSIQRDVLREVYGLSVRLKKIQRDEQRRNFSSSPGNFERDLSASIRVYQRLMRFGIESCSSSFSCSSSSSKLKPFDHENEDEDEEDFIQPLCAS
jgi:hypothetical protein